MTDTKTAQADRAPRAWFPMFALVSVVAAAALGANAAKPTKDVIGATAELTEVESGITFMARVDTGAKTCSLHVEKWEIENEAEKMRDNKGKRIRFQVTDRDGETHWLESKVASYAIYKTSEKEERRYRVWLTLRWKELEKKVLVNLNDRSHLEFPLLLGRNYLRVDLLVDVDKNNKED